MSRPRCRAPRALRTVVVALTGAAGLAVACASPGPPPGGPPDRVAPIILKVSPDSGATGVKAKSVSVRFNEVISERPRTGNDLSAVFVLSPSDGPARVDWHRDEVTVRPRKAFHPGTAYTLTVMPGVADLRGNATTRGHTFVFSTGGVIPHGALRGAVFDWTTLKPVNNALIEAQVGTDTTFKWVARSDSLGRYALTFLPSGSYLLRSLADANGNGKLDPREAWDTVTVAVVDSLRTDLYAFAHDTLGPRIVGADPKDSVTLRLTFDRPLALTPVLVAGQIIVQRADSSIIRVRSVVRAAQFDSLARLREAEVRDSTLKADTSAAGRAQRVRTDSARVLAQRDSIERARLEARRAARDTVPRVAPPVPSRQAITSEFIAALEQPMVPGTYRIITRDVVSASLVKRTSERTFNRAKPPEKKPEPAKPAGDQKGAAPAAGKPPTATKPAPKNPADSAAAAKPASPAPIKPPAP